MVANEKKARNERQKKAIEQYKEIKIQKGHSEEGADRMAKAQILDQWEVYAMTHLEEIEALKKEIDILRDHAQIDRLEADNHINNLQKIEKEHKKYVGDLLKELDSYKNKVQKLVNDPNYLRKLGVY